MSNLNIETYRDRAVRPGGSVIDCSGVPIEIHVKRPDGEDAAAALSNQRASSRLLPKTDSALSTLSKNKAAGHGGCFNLLGHVGNLVQSIIGCGRMPSKAKGGGGASSQDTVDTNTMNTRTGSIPNTVVGYYDDCCGPKSTHETSSMDVHPSKSLGESWDTAFRHQIPPPMLYPRKLKHTLYPIAEHYVPTGTKKGATAIPTILPSKTISSSNATTSRRQRRTPRSRRNHCLPPPHLHAGITTSPSFSSHASRQPILSPVTWELGTKKVTIPPNVLHYFELTDDPTSSKSGPIVSWTPNDGSCRSYGVSIGDHILKINGKDTRKMTALDVTRMLYTKRSKARKISLAFHPGGDATRNGPGILHEC